MSGSPRHRRAHARKGRRHAAGGGAQPPPPRRPRHERGTIISWSEAKPEDLAWLFELIEENEQELELQRERERWEEMRQTLRKQRLASNEKRRHR
jgi:hypothetical protein